MDRSQSEFLSVLESFSPCPAENGDIPFVIGADSNDDPVVKNFSTLPHLLIAGTTGTGKSTLAHGILLSSICNVNPDDLWILLCDTKIVEFSAYRDLPHLLCPPISDPSRISSAFAWVLNELNQRLRLIATAHCRSIETYNTHCTATGTPTLPRILLVIDDVTEAVTCKETWNTLRQLAQNSRAAGIHLLLITQNPGNKDLTDIIKSSIPGRAVFNVFSSTDEKLLLGTSKNSYLSDVGEIIFCIMPGKSKERIRCYQITDHDISTTVSKVSQRYRDHCPHDPILLDPPNQNEQSVTPILQGDEMFPAAVDIVLETGIASVSMLQRRLKLGYARTARIVDEMEEKGIVGPFRGSMPRAILITKEQWKERKFSGSSQMAIDDLPFDEVDSAPDDDSMIYDSPLSEMSVQSEPAFTQTGATSINVTQHENTTPAKLEVLPRPPAYSPKSASRKTSPSIRQPLSKIERIVFLCGCVLLLGGLLSSPESLSDKIGMLLFGLGFCVFATVRSLRWITISIVLGASGLVAVPRIWNSGTFDVAHMLTALFCLSISAIYSTKATKNRPRFHFRSRSASLKKVDAMSGIEFEEFTAGLLQKLGYTNVSVTQASGDQGIDVLAQKDGLRYAIQCKNYSGALGNTPVQEAFAGKVFYGCDVAVVLTNSIFTDGAFELAESTGVLLWDRDTLSDMIRHAK